MCNNVKDKCNKKISNINNKVNNDIGLDRFSYADFVLLSSTLAYAIFEELNDPDTDLLISFLSMMISDLALLRTQSAIALKKTQSSNQISKDNTADEIVSNDISEGSITRKLGVKKIKKKKLKK